MVSLWADYQRLLGSTEVLRELSQAARLEDFLQQLKSLWACRQLSDQELLDQLSLCNQTALTNAGDVAGRWMPYRYQASTQRVDWLFPIAYPREPFLDEYISACRQNLLNQLIRPFTQLQVVRALSTRVTAASPAGFIFHLSRCGSTLVSGCLSELETTCVFSEPPLLTELLLDAALSVEEKQASLRVFIDLQAAAFPDRPQVIIKWNAWDIFYWDLIRDLYPQVPALFLVRNPLEILASHQKLAGRHMSGEPGLAVLSPVFVNRGLSLLEFRVNILDALLTAMDANSVGTNQWVISYCYLVEQGVEQILGHFKLAPTKEERLKIALRSQVHSKQPQHTFVADSQFKQQEFSDVDKAYIQTRLQPLYQRLISVNRPQPADRR